MGRRRKPIATSVAALWAGICLAGVALGGHVLLPAADLVWFVLVVFAVAAVPGALRRGDADRPERKR